MPCCFRHACRSHPHLQICCKCLRHQDPGGLLFDRSSVGVDYDCGRELGAHSDIRLQRELIEFLAIGWGYIALAAAASCVYGIPLAFFMIPPRA